jgi:hypothetical protein
MVDLSHPTVCRWEISLAATQVAVFREFHASTSSAIEHDRFAVHLFSTDATNTSIWQQAKLHGLFLTTLVWDVDDTADRIASYPLQTCIKHSFEMLVLVI